jgi:hypothetical protein
MKVASGVPIGSVVSPSVFNDFGEELLLDI